MTGLTFMAAAHSGLLLNSMPCWNRYPLSGTSKSRLTEGWRHFLF